MRFPRLAILSIVLMGSSVIWSIGALALIALHYDGLSWPVTGVAMLMGGASLLVFVVREVLRWRYG
jgi:hypothetical protein